MKKINLKRLRMSNKRPLEMFYNKSKTKQNLN